ncbi:amidase [Paenarthrobacter sp. Z7-10]|uniref:amidase n=1 Tax=Paenarthrobacter sp. Z7-10 TaxID=2787635 RepID=UPI0022A9C4E2|nr:amidase [Paenarthrobacter sp. Z7-10]MCZ2403175.1 amidase [Paenarthrobacter sp. Z7-10]
MRADSLAGTGPFGQVGIAEVAGRIRGGEITAVEITEQALAAAHGLGTELNCFVTVDDDGARRAARLVDAELAAGLDRGPLHGIPVGIKDMIATAGLATTMGSRHFAGHVPHIDAAVVSSLRTAGAVILGKTQTHEFAYGPTSDRAATGAARNPQDPSRMTGGSSGGSGAAVAAGIVPLALGTDTGGSVRIPAALCGTVGLRPSQGAVDVQGVFPLAPTLDVVGPLAGSVADAAIGWWALSAKPEGFGARWSQCTPPRLPDGERVRNLRIARPNCDLTERVEASVRTAEQLAVDALDGISTVSGSGSVAHVAHGAHNVHFLHGGLPLPEIDETEGPYYDIQSAEAYAVHAERMRKAPELFDAEVLERLQAAAEVPGWRYVQALDIRRRLRASVLERMSAVDVLLMPTVPLEAPEIGQRDLGQLDLGQLHLGQLNSSQLNSSPATGWTGVRAALLGLTIPWSLLGFPAISVPVALPGAAMRGSVQLVAKPGQELLLLDAAALLESSLAAHAVN